MTSETKKAISLILIYLALLFFLIGMAAQLKESFHSRAEISTAGFTVLGVLVALGVITFPFSLGKKQAERAHSASSPTCRAALPETYLELPRCGGDPFQIAAVSTVPNNRN